MRNKGPAPIPYRRAEDLMHTGSVLMQMHQAGEMNWYLVPGGTVTQETAKKLRAKPNVSEGKDGLFPGINQTWRMVF